MNRKTLAIILLIAGGVLIFLGVQRKDSFAGAAEAAGTNLANSLDGGARMSDHTLYFVGGGALVLIGAVMAMRRTA